MRKIRFCALAMAVFMTFCFAGCKNKKNNNSSKPNKSTSSAASSDNSSEVIDNSSDDTSDISSDSSVSSKRPKPVKTDPNAIVYANWSGPAGYKIIAPAGNADMMKAAKTLQEYIKTKYKVTLTVAEDSAAKTKNEILIGATNRAESSKKTAYNDYSMSVKNGKLVFTAGSYKAMEQAICLFVSQENPSGKVQEFSGTNDFENTKLGKYKYVWGEEFNVLSLDKTYFKVADSVDDADAVDDKLVISDDERILSVKDGLLKMNATRYYSPTSATIEYAIPQVLSTRYTMNFQYGYLEMRARVPIKKGVNASLWLKGENKSGEKTLTDYFTEVDVFENFATEDTLYFGLHKWFLDRNFQTPKKTYVFSDTKNLAAAFHTYGFEWTPNEVSAYVDGKKYATFDLTTTFGDGDMSNFNEPFYLLLSDEIITPYTTFKPYEGSEISYSDLPAEFWVDWIRLYQKPDEGKLILK